MVNLQSGAQDEDLDCSITRNQSSEHGWRRTRSADRHPTMRAAPPSANATVRPSSTPLLGLTQAEDAFMSSGCAPGHLLGNGARALTERWCRTQFENAHT